MKSLEIIFSLVGLSLSSTCTDTKPEVNEDCLSVYMENNMCCYHEVTLGSKETKECVEKLSQIQDFLLFIQNAKGVEEIKN